MSKGSTRRRCQVSRVEEDLRWDLALGKITLAQFYGGVCSNCKDGLMTDSEQDYGITCRHDSTVHHQWYSCEKFQEDK